MTRKENEKKVIKIMIECYCKSKHQKGLLCEECTSLLYYANEKIEKCPLAERKTTCKKCSIHCYADHQRSKIREVMRFAGPRMIFKHPIIAIKHLITGGSFNFTAIKFCFYF